MGVCYLNSSDERICLLPEALVKVQDTKLCVSVRNDDVVVKEVRGYGGDFLEVVRLTCSRGKMRERGRKSPDTNPKASSLSRGTVAHPEKRRFASYLSSLFAE